VRCEFGFSRGRGNLLGLKREEAIAYPIARRMLRTRKLVKKIINPAKKIKGSGKYPSLTRNKLRYLY